MLFIGLTACSSETAGGHCQSDSSQDSIFVMSGDPYFLAPRLVAALIANAFCDDEAISTSVAGADPVPSSSAGSSGDD